MGKYPGVDNSQTPESLNAGQGKGNWSESFQCGMGSEHLDRLRKLMTSREQTGKHFFCNLVNHLQ